MNTTKQVLQLLNSNNIETTALEYYEKFYMFSVGVKGHDDNNLNLLYIQNDDDIITFCSPALYEYNENDFSAVITVINEMSVLSIRKDDNDGTNAVYGYIMAISSAAGINDRYTSAYNKFTRIIRPEFAE